uniref:Uncharacterized protein n=1 Tax=Arundo donax TaxID=35708 RepID=A0A0A9GV78_ARUDO
MLKKCYMGITIRIYCCYKTLIDTICCALSSRSHGLEAGLRRLGARVEGREPLEQRLVGLLRRLVVRAVPGLQVHDSGVGVELLDPLGLGRAHPRVQVTPQQQQRARQLPQQPVQRVPALVRHEP